MSEPKSRKTFVARLNAMVETLRGRILDGTYAEGDFLPAESALAKQFQLSNNSVRKGLATLVAEGLIVKLDKVGSRVTGCAERRRTTITIACYPSIERDLEFARLIDDFHASYPTIRVRPISIGLLGAAPGHSYTEALRECIGSGTADLVTLNHIHFSEMAERGWTGLLEPLDGEENDAASDARAEEKTASGETYPFLEEAFTVGGVRYVQPLVFSPVVLCYNKDHFAEAGLAEPDSGWTWDRLMRAAARLTVAGKRHGFHFYEVSENRWPLFLVQTGGVFRRGEDGRYGTAEAERLLEGIRLSRDIIRNRDVFPGYLAESEPDASRLFAEGKISMQLATYFSLNDIKHAAVNYDIAPVPYMAGRSPATLLIAIGLSANAQSPHKEAVRLFMRYAASRRAQELVRANTLSIPARKPAAESPAPAIGALNRPVHDQLFREIIPSYRWHAELGLPARLFEPLRRLIKMYWSDMIDECALLEALRRLDED